MGGSDTLSPFEGSNRLTFKVNRVASLSNTRRRFAVIRICSIWLYFGVRRRREAIFRQGRMKQEFEFRPIDACGVRLAIRSTYRFFVAENSVGVLGKLSRPRTLEKGRS